MILPVDPSRYAAFLVVMAAMAWTPGPANIFAVATGMERGKRAALAAVAGMNLATALWYLAGALGLAALIARFPAAMQLIALAGAAYLIWLAIGAFRAAVSRRAASEPLKPSAGPRKGAAFLNGFAVQIANPKLIVMFVGVLPAFLDASRPAAPQLALLAAATIGWDVISMSAYGLGGAALSARMTEPRFRRGFSLVVGLLLSLAAALVIANNLGCGSALGGLRPGC